MIGSEKKKRVVSGARAIEAWRVWKTEERFTPTGGRVALLKSTARGTIWASKILRADRAPYMDGFTLDRHGIWAYKTLASAKREFSAGMGYVYGKVKLYGKIVEHTRGYRAEYAEIVGLTKKQTKVEKHVYLTDKKLLAKYGTV